MKIRVVSAFYDKFHTNTLYTEGMVLDFEEKRANEIIGRHLAVAVGEEPESHGEATDTTEPEVSGETVEAPKETSEAVAEEVSEEKPEAEVRKVRGRRKAAAEVVGEK